MAADCACMRGVQKVCRPAQLITSYAHKILSLFDTFSCNWNALGPAFLQSSVCIVEELLFLVFQPAICRADNILIVRNFAFFREFFQFTKNQKSLGACSDVSSSTGCHPKCWLWTTLSLYSPFVFVLHGKWLAGRPKTTILLQRNQSFREMLDQVHFSCRILCLRSDKIRFAYLVVNRVVLQTFWMPLVHKIWSSQQFVAEVEYFSAATVEWHDLKTTSVSDCPWYVNIYLYDILCCWWFCAFVSFILRLCTCFC